MEKVETGKYVEIIYDLYKVNEDGTETLVHQSDSNDPESVVIGVTRGMVAPLEAAIMDKIVGDKFDVVASSAEAFGERSDEYIITLEKDVFSPDGKFDSEMVKVGAWLPMMTADGFPINGHVLEVNADNVKMDFNHPLAGSSVRYKGEIITVREATADDVQPAGCGCGCGCDHGDCGDDCHCGDGDCGCDDHECHCKG